MISRALERQIAEFVDLLESHFARIKQEFDRRVRRMSKLEQERLLTDALILAYRDRNNFDPALNSIGNWFSGCLEIAIYEIVVPDADELELLKKLSPTPSAAGVILTAPSREGAGPATAAPSLDPAQNIGKECPPCWRCRYFDGWLPKREIKPPTGNYSEIDLICFGIDQRKVAIANYVRDEYPEYLEN